MKNLIKLFILFASGFLFSSAWAQGQVLTPMDVFEMEKASDPQISPDGKRVLFVRSFADIMTDTRYSNIWIVNSDGSGSRALTTGNYGDSKPRWSPKGDKIAYTSNKEGSSEIYVRWMDTGDSRKISNLPKGPTNITWSPDGSQIAFVMLKENEAPKIVDMPKAPAGAKWKEGPHITDKLVYRFDGAGYLTPGYYHIYIIPADGGTAKQISSGDFNHGGPTSRGAGPLNWSLDGSSITQSLNRQDFAEYNVMNSNIYSYNVKDGSITQLTDRDGPDNGAVLSPDGKWLAYIGFDDRKQGFQRSTLHIIPAGGGVPKILSDDIDRSIRGMKWDPNSKSIVVMYNNHGMGIMGRFGLNGKFTEITQTGQSSAFTISDNGKIALTHIDTKTSPEIAIVGKGGALNQITHVNADLLENRTLGEVEEIWYKSSYDGQDIQGWIIKPPNFDPNNKYPMVIKIHGGPFSDYGFRFNYEMQLMVAQGYVMLYTNPRGSTGYGEEFSNAIHHAYPGHDFEDLNSGVDAVVDLGFVDEDRLYVTGGSGGGVLTAWMIGNTNRFKAAAIHYPVIEWQSFNLTADIHGLVNQYWFPDLPWRAVEHYAKRSLLSVVDNVETPTIIITGEHDWRTPINQAEQYYSALKINGVEAVNVRIPDEPHGTSVHPSHHITRIMNTMGWFESHN
ncbi:MAG: S9 family peptidase [Sphingomonadales bacterium]